MFYRIALASSLACGLAFASACTQDSSADNKKRPSKAQVANAASKTPAATPGAAKTTKAPAAVDGTKYGDGVGAAEAQAVSISELLANPKEYAGKNVRVEGTVTDVCPKRGCWFEMAGEKPGEKMRFKVRDGVMTFPMDAKGKYAVAEGVLETTELSLEKTREFLEYQAKEYGKEIDPAQMDKPMTRMRIKGKGAVIRDAK